MPNTNKLAKADQFGKKLIESLERSLIHDGTGREMRFTGGDVTPVLMPVQEWISVKDKYPNHGDVVLICTKDKDIHAFQWDAVYDGWVGDRYNFSKKMVTHWMPLPEPPKGE